jgi:hypothetical protein
MGGGCNPRPLPKDYTMTTLIEELYEIYRPLTTSEDYLPELKLDEPEDD